MAARKNKTPKNLTLKQQAFIEHYIANGGNGVKAAEAAGYSGNRHTLEQMAYENLRKPVIYAYTRERLQGVKANADEVLYLLADHMRADVAVFEGCLNENGTLNLTAAKKAGCSHLVKKIKTRNLHDRDGNSVTTTEIELHDSQAAARTLAEIHGLKQQPRQNEDDVVRVNREIARLVSEGWEPDEAKAIVLEAEPRAARWLM